MHGLPLGVLAPHLRLRHQRPAITCHSAPEPMRTHAEPCTNFRCRKRKLIAAGLRSTLTSREQRWSRPSSNALRADAARDQEGSRACELQDDSRLATWLSKSGEAVKKAKRPATKRGRGLPERLLGHGDADHAGRTRADIDGLGASSDACWGSARLSTSRSATIVTMSGQQCWPDAAGRVPSGRLTDA